MVIERLINGIKHEIPLEQSEIDKAYRMVETDYFKQDFISMCKDQKKLDLLPEVLHLITIEDQTELLNHAYEYYHKIHDCNLDYNSMLDSAIDDAAKWYQSQKLNALHQKLYQIMSDTRLCKQLGESLFDNLNTDEEPLKNIGYYLCKAYLEEDVDQLLIAISGWSMDSLLNLTFIEEMEK